MPQNKAPSSFAQWPLVLRGLLVAAALGCLVFALSRRGVAPPAGTPTAPSAAARTPRSPRPVDVAARPRAGITGHVLDPAQKPVAAASVCAWAAPGNGLVTTQTRAPRCAKSDGAGAYALTDLFPATPLVVSASAPSFAPVGFGGLRLADGEQRAGVDLVLRGGGVRLDGIVDDVTGGAVAGATVATWDETNRAVATTDAKGEFTLWVEPGSVRVGATAAGYAPGWASGPAPGHAFKIHLVPGSTLVGRTVLAGTDTPVSGVMIEGIQVEGGNNRGGARTDEEGRFQVDSLAPGRYRVEATSEGREGYSRSSITLGLGETSAEVLIELDPAYVVRGRVVDKATGEPCHGGEVTITDRKQNEFSRAAIEPDGWARMASVIPGNYRVEVSCKDHVDRDDYPTVAIKDADAPPLTWEVDRGATARIDVVDEQRRPITKATVTAFASGPEASYCRADHVETDGAFLISGLKPGEYHVTVRSEDGGRADRDVTLALGREERVSIDVPSAGAIEGVVEDDAHRPVPNVQITATGPGYASARSLDDGTFSLTGLRPGEYEVRTNEGSSRLRGTADGQADGPPPVKVTVTPPEHAKVRVTVAGRNGTIEGRVTDSTDKPVTDAFIDFVLAEGGAGVPRYGGSGRAPIVTDTDGRFTVDGLADGTYNLRASRKGGGEANVDGVKVGTRDVALKLGEGGSIAGTLTSRNAPVERFTVTVRETKSSFSRDELFFHAQGAFALHDLPPGTYEVEAETPSGTATAEVTLAEGEQKTGVALTLTLRGAIDGRLVELESGAPIAGARLGVDGSSSASLVNGDNRDSATGADGHFHLEGVLAGKWSLSVSPADSSFDYARIPVVVQEGGGTSDLGAIRIPRRRLAPGEQRGDLGFYVDPGESSGEVKVVSGAAEEAGIQVGDVVASIDGFDVRGTNQYLLPPLTTVAAGRTVSVGLARGTTASVVARGPGGMP